MELLIESLEGDIYLAFQVQASAKSPIVDQQQNPLRFRSLEQIRSHCEGEGYQSATLRHNTAYDEMCGSGSMGVNTMCIDLKWF